MMRHVLVAKGLWNVVHGVRKRLVVENTNTDGIDSIEDVDHRTHAHAVVSVVQNAEQLRWDGRDAQGKSFDSFVCETCH